MALNGSDDTRAYREAWFRLVAQHHAGYPVAAAMFESYEAFGPSVIPGWSPDKDDGVGWGNRADLAERADEILDKRGEDLLEKYPQVTGVAVSLRYRRGEVLAGHPCITFFVAQKLSPKDLGDSAVPLEIDGVPTDVVEAGVPQLHRARPRHHPGARLKPAEPGASISHARVSSGTFGCLVKDSQGRTYLLSCTHVLLDATGTVGDPVVHPGTLYGGTAPADQVARLTKALKVASRVPDAAIAEVVDPSRVTSAIRYIGAKPAGTRVLRSTGVQVQKSGDKTGLTFGTVIGLGATVGPYHVNGMPVRYTRAIVTNGMSEPGDSGSVLLDYTNRAVGLLFGALKSGGAGRARYVTSWHSPIEPVLKQLGVHLP